MNAARHNRVVELFLAASQLEDGRREDYLTLVCGDDQTLRADVESLLKYHTERTLFADTPTPVILADEMRAPDGDAVESPRRIAALFRRHPFLIASGLALLLLVGTAAWVHHRIKASLRESLATQLRTVLDADVAALENWIAVQMADVTAWSNDDTVRRIVEQLTAANGTEASSPDGALQALNDQLLDVLTPVMQRQGFHSLGVVTPEGISVASSRRPSIGAPVSPTGAPYLSRLNRGESIFAIPTRERKFVVAIESSPRDPTVAVAAPVRSAQGSIIASLCFGFDVDGEFTRILSIARLGATGETYALDKDAVLLSNVRDYRLVTQIGLVPADHPCALNMEVRDPGGDLLAGYRTSEPLRSRPLTKLAARAIAGHDGWDVDGYRNYRGAMVVGAWKWLANYDFGVGTEIAAAEAYRPLRYISSAFAFLSGTVAVLALIVGLTSCLTFQLRKRIGQAERLGAYVLGDLIGQGGMAKVYRAWHHTLKRTAAVKLLDKDEADDEMIRRFKREVQVTCQLTHPSTIQVYDFGVTTKGSFYYAMEFLPGWTLQQVIAVEKVISVERTLHIVLQICGSLGEAHDKGLVHRDIKPGNIMLTERGGISDFVKVLDFGLAKPFRSAQYSDVTRAQAIIGTPQYIAPERILSPEDVDARSDVYSLGAVMYMMLTGQHVFPDSEPTALFRRIVSEDGPHPSSVSPQPIPAELDSLVGSCLAVDRNSRPASVAEIAAVAEDLAKQFPWTQAAARAWWAERCDSVQGSTPDSAFVPLW